MMAYVWYSVLLRAILILSSQGMSNPIHMKRSTGGLQRGASECSSNAAQALKSG